VIMCVLVIFYPVHDARYFLPALPILFYYCYKIVSLIIAAISVRYKNSVMAIFTTLYLLLGYSYIKTLALTQPAGCVALPNDLAAFKYISQHVSDDDAIAFAKPRALTLFTGKKTFCETWQVSDSMNKILFEGAHVRYILVRYGLDERFFLRYLRNIQHPVDSVNIAEGYTLFALH
jgi:hypothetical protein